MRYDCLIIDDEVELAEATCEYFDMFGLQTKYVATASECMEVLQKHEVRLLLLDINLKEESGFALCKQIRESYDLPILFISARQSDDDILIALNIGGDDYIKKPYTLSVLLAKVKVILKRMDQTKKPLEKKTEGLFIDQASMRVYVDGKEVHLKAKEFRLLQYLYTNKNKVVPKAEIFRQVWGDDFFSDGTLNVHIRKIREKIEKNPNEPTYIKTIWGTGYMLEL